MRAFIGGSVQLWIPLGNGAVWTDTLLSEPPRTCEPLLRSVEFDTYIFNLEYNDIALYSYFCAHPAL